MFKLPNLTIVLHVAAIRERDGFRGNASLKNPQQNVSTRVYELSWLRMCIHYRLRENKFTVQKGSHYFWEIFQEKSFV